MGLVQNASSVVGQGRRGRSPCSRAFRQSLRLRLDAACTRSRCSKAGDEGAASRPKGEASGTDAEGDAAVSGGACRCGLVSGPGGAIKSMVEADAGEPVGGGSRGARPLNVAVCSPVTAAAFASRPQGRRLRQPFDGPGQQVLAPRFCPRGGGFARDQHRVVPHVAAFAAGAGPVGLGMNDL